MAKLFRNDHHPTVLIPKNIERWTLTGEILVPERTVRGRFRSCAFDRGVGLHSTVLSFSEGKYCPFEF